MKRAEQGYIVLISVLILGLIATTIATFLLVTGQNSSITSSGVDGKGQAQAAADGCAQLALSAIQQNTSLATPASNSATLDPITNETCSYNITGTNPNFIIVASGKLTNNIATYNHTVTITTNSTNPNISIASWVDSQ